MRRMQTYANNLSDGNFSVIRDPWSVHRTETSNLGIVLEEADESGFWLEFITEGRLQKTKIWVIMTTEVPQLSKMKEKKNRNPNDIAVVGMAGRFPGADDLNTFWQNLRNGVESITFFSDEELLESGVDTSWVNHPKYVRAGGVLNDIESFDASFFGFTSREAKFMDPQYRVFLECCWHALENSGYVSGNGTGKIGLFAGSRLSEYLLNNHERPDMVGFGQKSLITSWQQFFSNDKDCLTSFTSYKLDLKGPVVTVQTACSTSLTAIHLGVKSLANGESDMVLAGGVCLRVPQRAGYPYNEGMIFSADGHTRSFDARGSGTVFSSGVGVVVLKRLSDAMADKDTIHAVIKGTGIGNDGAVAKAGFTAPSEKGQAELIERVWSSVDFDPKTISYIEAHGTGTIVGDPIEVAALTQAFHNFTLSKRFCAIGSVKSNIGHLVQAAGVAGLIKVILMMKNRELAPTINFDTPNSQIDFLNSPFYVNASLTPWKADGFPRRAGISSFGIGGTNAHIILEESPGSNGEDRKTNKQNKRALEENQAISVLSPAKDSTLTEVLFISAKCKNALRTLVNRYGTFFESNSETNLRQICFTSRVGREHFDHRIAVVAHSCQSMGSKLRAFGKSDLPPGLLLGKSEKPATRKLAFLFSGQGSQYLNMGKELYTNNLVYRNALHQCNEYLEPNWGLSLMDVLFRKGKTHPRLEETIYAQPAIFSLEYALAMVWLSWGVKPQLIMGHSIGEYAAACLAKVFRLEDALKLVSTRSRLMQDKCKKGRMVALMASEEHTLELIKPYRNKIAIAAKNGPENLVLSGEINAVEEIISILDKEEIKTKKLNVFHGFHSPLMKPMLKEFSRVAEEIKYAEPHFPMVSTVTGTPVNQEICTPAYWVRHVSDTVRFHDGIVSAHNQNCRIFLEIGPKPVLLGMGCQCMPDPDIAWLPSLREGQSDRKQILSTLAALYVRGVNMDLEKIDGDPNPGRVALPGYPFQRKRYWIRKSKARDVANTFSVPLANAPHSFAHPLLGVLLPSPLKERQFQSVISPDRLSFLREHRVFEAVVFPGTAFIEMAISAAGTVFGSKKIVIESLVIQKPLRFTEEEEKALQVILTPHDKEAHLFQIFSSNANDTDHNIEWNLHVTGKVLLAEIAEKKQDIILRDLQNRSHEVEFSIESFYQKKRERGLYHGPSFRGITKLWLGEKEALGRIEIPEEIEHEIEMYEVHPAVLDSCLQVSEAAFSVFGRENGNKDVFLPMVFDRIQVFEKPKSPLWVHARSIATNSSNQELKTVDISLLDELGKEVLRVSGLHFKLANRRSLMLEAEVLPSRNLIYEIEWRSKALEKDSSIRKRNHEETWVLFGKPDQLSHSLRKQILDQGNVCIFVKAGAAFASESNHEFTIDASEPQDYKEVITNLSHLRKKVKKVVYLWSAEEKGIRDKGSEGHFLEKDSNTASGLYLVQALSELPKSESPELWFITRGAQAVKAGDPIPGLADSPLWGFARVVMREYPELNCSLVDLDPFASSKDTSHLLSEMQSQSKEHQVAFRTRNRYVPRLIHSMIHSIPEKEDKTWVHTPVSLKIPTRGTFDNLSLQSVIRKNPGADEIEIRVRHAGLNFRDVLNALDRYPGDPGPLGLECSGIIESMGENVEKFKIGDAVIAKGSECFGTFVVVKSEFVVKKPDFITFEEAATIPVAFLTAYYGLVHLAKIKAGDLVLIHAAAGGVGFAAVQIAKQTGAEVFTTASKGKWDFLRSIGVDHIMDSRSLEFADKVMELTKGNGVRIVLNSLSGEFISKSMSILATNGCFLEIGKTGILDTREARKIRPDISYFPYDLGEFAQENPIPFQSMFEDLMECFRKKTLTPLPVKLFSLRNAIDAFRYMAQAKHIGKIVLFTQEAAPPEPSETKTDINSKSTYLVTGGMGALGLLVAGWFSKQGAKSLVLVGRKNPSIFAKKKIKEMEKDGVKFVTIQADVSKEKEVSKVMELVKTTGLPLRGIVHAAGTLDDGIIIQQTWQRFQKVMKPKVEGGWLLHQATKYLDLDFFILFSSVSSALGNPGQGNYAAANAYLDALAHHRRSIGLPATSINWGAWGEVGMAANLDKSVQERRAAGGSEFLESEIGLEAFGNLLENKKTQVGVFKYNWPIYFQKFSKNGIPAFYSEIISRNLNQSSESEASKEIQRSGIAKKLESASPEKHRTLMAAYVQEQARKYLGLESHSTINPDESLIALGLDSLTAIEMKNALEINLELPLPATLLFDVPVIDDLSKFLMHELEKKNLAKAILINPDEMGEDEGVEVIQI